MGNEASCSGNVNVVVRENIYYGNPGRDGWMKVERCAAAVNDKDHRGDGRIR